MIQTAIRENTPQNGTFRVSEDYEGRGDARGLRENRLQRVDDTAHHKKVFINDSSLEGFFRSLRDTINQHLEEEGINLINVDIEEDKLDYSFYEWWQEQELDQRRSPSLALRSA